MEKRINSMFVIQRTVPREKLCVVDYMSESKQTYRWEFYNTEVVKAVRSVAHMVVASEGDLSYIDAFIINEMIRDAAGDDS